MTRLYYCNEILGDLDIRSYYYVNALEHAMTFIVRFGDIIPLEIFI